MFGSVMLHLTGDVGRIWVTWSVSTHIPALLSITAPSQDSQNTQTHLLDPHLRV